MPGTDGPMAYASHSTMPAARTLPSMVRKILPLALAPSASATEAAPCEDRANSMAEVRICQAELARTRVKLPRSWEMQPDRRP